MRWSERLPAKLLTRDRGHGHVDYAVKLGKESDDPLLGCLTLEVAEHLVVCWNAHDALLQALKDLARSYQMRMPTIMVGEAQLGPLLAAKKAIADAERM